ncbi:MAG: Lrp/AsnC family transcriptional regulator [Halocynthiibacter sp.]
MDNFDTQLIRHLKKDGRASISELAARTGLARATVRARIDALLKHGDIARFTIETGADIAKAPVRGLMMLGLEGRGMDRVQHALSRFSEVEAIHNTNGKWDLIVELGTDTLEHFDQVLADIRKIDSVTTSETNLLLSTRRART